MGLQFDTDKDTLEGVFTEAAEAFGKELIQRLYNGETGMDWTVSGGETWGGQFAFDFEFRHSDGVTGKFQMQLVAVRDMQPEDKRIAEMLDVNFIDEQTAEYLAAAEEHEVEDMYRLYEQERDQCPECARGRGPNYTGPCNH